MAGHFVRQTMLWLLLSLPVGLGAGAAVSALLGTNADIDRFTAGFNGAIAGALIALIGALTAAGTNTIAYDRLKAAGGSPFLTGLAISYGSISVVLGLMLLI